ncbi:MAG: RNA pseudouridine synthase [Verrucomicrobia bacterium]|nr:RNA pseudouridine synthase [Verrucomicrobiota bacterium]
MSAAIKLSSPATQEFWEIPVLFEDQSLLALDKPARLLSSPDRDLPDRPSLMGLLHEGIARRAAWASTRGLTYLAAAHRLDFETSGVMLLAKDKPALLSLANQFNDGRPVKTYAALVQGRPEEQPFRVDAPLAPHPGQPGLMHVDSMRGKKSATDFYVREEFSGWTLLECRPVTERPHQIRVHLCHARLPVVGDAAYGGRPLLLSKLKRGYRLKPHRTENPLLGRSALHAEKLTITHPITGATVEISAPWPRDFNVALKYLRRYAAASVLGNQPDQPPADEEGDAEQENAGEV